METRQQLLKDAAFFLKKETVTRSDREAFDRIIERVDRMETRESRYAGAPPREQPGGGYAGGRIETAEARAFGRYIQFGEAYENRDITAGGDGAAIIPQEFYPVLTEAKKAWGPVVDIVNVKETVSGAPMKFAFSNDTGNLAHVVGEEGPVSEVDPALSSLLSNTDQCATGFILISVAELQDSAFDLDKFCRDNFGKRYYRGLTSLMTNGSPSGNIESIVAGAFNAHTSIYGDHIDYDDIVALYGALDPAYIENATWVMKSTTRAALLGIKDSLGRPLYVPSPTAGAFDKLLGQPVVLNQYMDDMFPSGGSPDVDVIPIQFGDFSQGYTLRLVKPGLAIVRLSERFMDTLRVGFLGYFRAGGVVTDAGTHPITNLVMNT